MVPLVKCIARIGTKHEHLFIDTIQSDLQCILFGGINTFLANVPILENPKNP